MTVRTRVREIALKTTDGGDDDGENHRLRSLCHLVLTLPEFQLD